MSVTAAMTVRTRLLHGEEALAHLHLALNRDRLDRSPAELPGFRAAAVANVTLFQRRNADLFGDAANGLLEGQLHVVAQIGTARWRADGGTTAAKNVAEIRRQRYR
jgi:hypothetical protein